MKKNEFYVNWYAYKVLRNAKYNEKIFVKDILKLCKNDSLFARAVVDALIAENHFQYKPWTDSLDLSVEELKESRRKFFWRAAWNLIKWRNIRGCIYAIGGFATALLAIVALIDFILNLFGIRIF